jgi:hypothetical protein
MISSLNYAWSLEGSKCLYILSFPSNVVSNSAFFNKGYLWSTTIDSRYLWSTTIDNYHYSPSSWLVSIANWAKSAEKRVVGIWNVPFSFSDDGFLDAISLQVEAFAHPSGIAHIYFFTYLFLCIYSVWCFWCFSCWCESLGSEFCSCVLAIIPHDCCQLPHESFRSSLSFLACTVRLITATLSAQYCTIVCMDCRTLKNLFLLHQFSSCNNCIFQILHVMDDWLGFWLMSDLFCPLLSYIWCSSFSFSYFK